MQPAPGGPRTLLSQLWPVAGWALFFTLAWYCRETLSILFLAVLLSYLLRAPVDALAARRVPRGLAAALSLLGLLALAVALAAWLAPVLYAQAAELVRDLPRLGAEAGEKLRGAHAGLAAALPPSWLDALDVQLRALVPSAGTAAVGMFSKVASGVPKALGLVLVPILAFYIAKDLEGIEAWILGLLPRSRAAHGARMIAACDRTLTGYVRGQSLVCLIQAAQCGLAFTLLRLPYGVVLGTLAGLAETVPFVGSTAVMVLIVLLAGPAGGWTWAYGLAAYAVLNQVLNYLISPRIMKQQLEVHPLAVLLAVGAGAELGGLYGVIFALPLTAVGKAVLQTWQEGRGKS